MAWLLHRRRGKGLVHVAVTDWCLRPSAEQIRAQEGNATPAHHGHTDPTRPHAMEEGGTLCMPCVAYSWSSLWGSSCI